MRGYWRVSLWRIMNGERVGREVVIVEAYSQISAKRFAEKKALRAAGNDPAISFEAYAAEEYFD